MDAKESRPSDASERPPDVEGPCASGKRRNRWLRLLALGATAATAALVSFTLSSGRRADPAVTANVVRVERGELVKTLVTEGAVESSEKVVIKCDVPGGSTLLWIIEDGSQVKAGDELARLDSSLLDEQVAEQTILAEQAKAALISAQRSLAAAEISIEEYREGVYVQTRQELKLAEATADHQLREAQNSLTQASHLARRGYVSPLQLAGEEAAVEHARLSLGVAQRAVQVLEDYTRPKMLQELQSLRDAAEATLRAAQATFDLENERLKRLETQVANCLIRAPQDGMVIHANDPRRSSDGPQIDLGAMIRQRQAIIWLPDLSRMQVRAVVHESQIPFVHPGLRARVTVQGREFTGKLATIANQPERTRSSQRHLKYFAATILIDDDSGSLRPGQTAEAEILLTHHRDVLTVPVSAIVQQGDDVYAWVQTPSAPERRSVQLGAVNDKFAEISSGLSEHDPVLSHPRSDAAELLPAFEPRAHIDPVERFGIAGPVEDEAPPAFVGRRNRQPSPPTGGG